MKEETNHGIYLLPTYCYKLYKVYTIKSTETPKDDIGSMSNEI